MYIRSTLIIIVFLFSSIAFAQQRLEMEGTAIIGNKELPNVLYIVPWKAAEPVTLQAPPINSVLDDILNPVARSTFQQQVNYYNELYPSSR